MEPWDLKWSKIVPTRIGHACVCIADGVFLFTTNLLNGIDQYRFPSLEKLQKDDDVDVRYFATTAAAAVNGTASGGEPMSTSP